MSKSRGANLVFVLFVACSLIFYILLTNVFQNHRYLHLDIDSLLMSSQEGDSNNNLTLKDIDLDSLYKVVNNLNIGPKFGGDQYCNIPLYIDPYDEAAKEYMVTEKLNCPIGHKFTFVDENGFLMKNGSSKVKCKYVFLRRKPHDQQNTYSKEYALPDEGVQLPDNDPFVKVNCYQMKPNKLIYANTHLRIPSFKGKSSAKTPSVLILVVESLSVLSYNRYLLKTKAAIERMGGMQVLKGLTKIGRNSFPNSFGFLAGVPMQDEDCSRIKHWDKKFRYIWDDFKDAGYVTGFAEDMAQAGLFTYYSTGFVKPPTDWYPTPFWINMYPGKKDWSKIWKNPQQYCYGTAGPKIDIFLDQVYNFHTSLRRENSTYFMYSFYSQSCHEEFNTFQYVDDAIAKFIERIGDKLKDVIFIMMGDHGIMHGDYTDTPLGHLEGSLPYFGIRIPETLNDQYPHLKLYLEKNQYRLVSWWDIRKMVLDVSKGKFDVEEYNETAAKNVYLSPWRQTVPLNRSCADAGVPDQWCVCNGVLGELPKHEDYYKSFIKTAVTILNEVLNRYSCPRLEFKKTIRINHILPRKDEKIALKEIVSLVLHLKSYYDENLKVHFMLSRTRNKVGEKWSEWRLFGNASKAIASRLCNKGISKTNKLILIY